MLLLAAPLCLVLFAARDAGAQASSGGGFVLTPQVVAGGGGSSAGGAFALAGTVAQHDAATSAGGAFTLEGGFWPALGPDAPPAACAVDVTALLSVTRGGFSQNLVTRLYRQTVTIQNLGATAVEGPLVYVLDGLTPGVSLKAPSGSTTCAAPEGSPYVLVPTSGGRLAPGESVSLLLEYAVSGTTRSINYNARLLSGATR
jgi:hypothetical protein